MGRTKRVVLVGSSFGATIAARGWRGICPRSLAWPWSRRGRPSKGKDIYRPFARVRNLPAYLVAAQDDNVAKEPLGALSRMAPQGTLKTYPGSRHSAGHLGGQHPLLWRDLTRWLTGVYDTPLSKRRSRALRSWKGSPRVTNPPEATDSRASHSRRRRLGHYALFRPQRTGGRQCGSRRGRGG